MPKRPKPVAPPRFDPSVTEGPNWDQNEVVHGLRSRFEAIDRSARNGADYCAVWGERWGKVYLTLGLPAAVLAAIAGAAALHSNGTRVIGGVVALISSGVSAAAAFLDGRNKQQHYMDLAGAWSALESDVATVLTSEMTHLSELGRELSDLSRPSESAGTQAWTTPASPEEEARRRQEDHREAQRQARRRAEREARSASVHERFDVLENRIQLKLKAIQDRQASLLQSKVPGQKADESPSASAQIA